MKTLARVVKISKEFSLFLTHINTNLSDQLGFDN